MVDNLATQRKTASLVPTRVHFVLLAVQFGFGSMHVAAKGVLEHLHPLTLAMIRACSAAPILLVAALVIDRNPPKGKDYLHLAILGFFGVFANQLLFIFGLRLTTATNAGILMPSVPVLAALIGVAFRVEKISTVKIAGIALAVVGSLVMLDIGRFSLAGGRALGNVLILTNCASFACYLVLQKPLLDRLGPLTVTAWAYVFGAIGISVAGAIGAPKLDIAEVPSWVWFAVAYIVLIPTITCYLANTWAIGQSTPSLAATYITLQPLASASLAAIFLGESVGYKEAAGFLLIVGGLALVSRHREPIKSAKDS